MTYNKFCAVCLVALGFASPMPAGTFQFSTTTEKFDPFIVVHPFGYDGSTGGTLDIRICVSSGLERMAPAIFEAIAVWNALTPETENCTNCELWEDPLNAEAPLSMSSVLIHELGHCALGIDHINWEFGGSPESSFTSTANANVIDVGVDGVRGTSDDIVLPLPGAGVVHWFRKTDNDPFVIDETIIDISTYSRRIIDLMALGHGWSANANRRVGEELGLMDSQAVMYSNIGDGQRYTALGADDVSTVRFGMSGMDEMAGTADDYSIELIFVVDCVDADLEIQFTDAPANIALCLSDLETLPGGGIFDIHHVMVPFVSESRLLVQVNSTVVWDVVFADGFETGDLSSWAE